MRTRIRELRKLRGLTLKQLAEQVGTTPQTIQRLETANMTVSTTWLERIASALRMEPAELLALSGARDVPFLGRIGENGTLYRSGYDPSSFALDIPAKDPLAARLDYATGDFQIGSILIAAKLPDTDASPINGANCLVALDATTVRLRRVFYTQSGEIIFASLNAGKSVEVNQNVEWIARIIMSIRYF